jgi:hypothetical protein
VYIGLGSMLGCMFSAEEATAILAVLAGAVLRVQQQQPCCAIIHCATGEAVFVACQQSCKYVLWYSLTLVSVGSHKSCVKVDACQPVCGLASTHKYTTHKVAASS